MLNQGLTPICSDVHVIEQVAHSKGTTLVGAYCRVSTDKEIQKASLDIQMAAYERIIEDHPGWVLAGIYADKGLSGTSVNKRTEFLRMIEDARKGKIDYILVKSISRFSRNTVDLLQYIRELKQIGVNVYFEKEHIDTGTSNSEFMLSLFGAAAQEEIISLSNNVKMGKRMRFARGEQPWTHIYGYERGWKIVPQEAAVIQRIYDMYLNGVPLLNIVDVLNEEGIPCSSGYGRWQCHTISEIMKNEKYAGHIRMQKTYIKDPITHERASNRNAVIKQFFKRDHHAPIVSEDVWEAANLVMTMKNKGRGTPQYPFYGILHCPYCGANMVRFFYRQGEWFWTCGGNRTGNTREKRSDCPPYAIHETTLINTLTLAGIPLEYWPLKQRFPSISFPADDWSHLRIERTDQPPLLLSINYEQVSNMPLPTIRQEPYEWQYVTGPAIRMTTFINDIPIQPAITERILKRIRTIQDRVRQLSILPPEPYEADVPKVEYVEKAR